MSEKPQFELPQGDFNALMSMLVAQAISSLGKVPNNEGKTEVSLPTAKFFIDMLGALEEKTKGNLTDAEAETISQYCTTLRFEYAQVAK